MTTSFSPYIGRFAPSPSGPLHFGSLIAALGSYLRARQQRGQWLLRIEDIDPPREMPGAAEGILETLQAHGLNWDGEVSYQSQHSPYYDAALAALDQTGRTYFCQCSRAQIRAAGGHYPGTCRDKGLSGENCSLRLMNTQPVTEFNDINLGQVIADGNVSGEDFILRRKDGFYAYHLAVVVDDLRQGVTEIVRGADLLETTCCQMALYQALGAKTPAYLHLPVAVTEPGFKLSKQNHAPALENKHALQNLRQAMVFLGFDGDKLRAFEQPASLLDWAVTQWELALVPKLREKPYEGTPS
ncbi:Glutamyl-Q tRNA(Asp) synthetase [Saliniradius amylolyticus]|uniref:Glutamyl-Q tRNA(Asp) synthetase n=1 Tax=Saliniradius amylolyticus TaxID=2183582 RepID=A0A2S2DZM4_9ALTE|nr:tRNA glutamyl-Q(34) synthetase GluQRS [Saliniradius amylolyticus]AWL10865.1 Glutamyl-Q tRNA(Asp) synthetase [Saliniradius amylolyticus]